jgi:hypothetical protein
MAAAALFMVVGVLISRWEGNRIQKVIQQWPTTEASIEGGTFSKVPHGGEWEPMKAPILHFSYHVGGEYFSGRVALMEFFDDEDAAITQLMLRQKLEIHYDPQDSTRWFIDDDKVAGCRFRQEGIKAEDSRSF